VCVCVLAVSYMYE